MRKTGRDAQEGEMKAHSIRWTALGALALSLTIVPELGQEETPPLPPSSELTTLTATQGLILDMAETDSRAIAVGARGAVLVSESRSDWRQIENVPTRATLTA